jgi:hypothetical protein
MYRWIQWRAGKAPATDPAREAFALPPGCHAATSRFTEESMVGEKSEKTPNTSQVVLKPAGLIIVLGTIGILATLALRRTTETPPDQMALPAAAPATATPRKSKNGLTGKYFGNMYLDGAPAYNRVDSTVNFNWRKATPGSPVPDDQFSVRWEGFIEPVINGEHTFTVIADNGCKVWVNAKQVIDLWRPADSKKLKEEAGMPLGEETVTESGKITLKAGQKVPIRIDYYESRGDANVQLLWSYPGQPRQFVPQSRLTPLGQ